MCEQCCSLSTYEEESFGVQHGSCSTGDDRLQKGFAVGDEGHIHRRLEREKRCGHVEKIDDNTYRFVADVYDTSEMIPWIRTFICRIAELNFSNKVLEKQFKNDIKKMYRMYGIEEVES